MGADSVLMVQSFNRKDMLIYVKLRNYDLGDQSHTALRHLFTKLCLLRGNSNAVQLSNRYYQEYFLASYQMKPELVVLCLIDTVSCGNGRETIRYFVMAVKKNYFVLSIEWKSTYLEFELPRNFGFHTNCRYFS